MFRNQCYATMPMFANAHISSLGYLCLHQANGDPAVCCFALAAQICFVFVSTKRGGSSKVFATSLNSLKNYLATANGF